MAARTATAPGLALFIRNGMTAWMRAWSWCAQGGNADSPLAANAQCPTPDYSIEIRSQLATILASLILNQQLEIYQ